MKKMNQDLERHTPAQRMSPTIRDVARAASVSVGTVSKVLNGQEGLRHETRERVLAAVERIGYRPNALFQSVLRGRSLTVGLISTDAYGRFTMPLLEGVESSLGEAGMSVFLASAADDLTRERRHIESFLSKRVDGLIVTGSRTDPRPPLELGNSHVPVVYAYTQVQGGGAFCLLPDDFTGGKLAAEHLASLGRSHIAYIGGSADFEATRLRLDGAQAGLERFSLSIPSKRILYGPWAERWGYQAALQLLARDPEVNGIFCGNDEIAWGVLNALAEKGVTIPDDVAVVGYDNWAIPNEARRPTLSSVDMNLVELGAQAGNRMLALIEGQRISGVEKVAPRLVVRHSSSPSIADTPQPHKLRKRGNSPRR